MLENENEKKIINNSKNNIQECNFSEVTNKTKDKEIQKTLNNKNSNNDSSILIHVKNSNYEELKKKRKLSQKNIKHKKLKIKCASFKPKKNMEKKISNILTNNKKLKIPNRLITINVSESTKSYLCNTEKNVESPKKSNRLDSYGNKINKENKRQVHINFKDNFSSKKLIDIIPIESLKNYNINEEIPDETFPSNMSKCCSIF